MGLLIAPVTGNCPTKAVDKVRVGALAPTASMPLLSTNSTCVSSYPIEATIQNSSVSLLATVQSDSFITQVVTRTRQLFITAFSARPNASQFEDNTKDVKVVTGQVDG